ncbi:MAG TPA: cytochrome c biogenesis protein ResB, partial [Alphaproteobacteria bacterium]|nr:cytochrome c biogenesis protein ResB [Alphaproteobacteria bacterium]
MRLLRFLAAPAIVFYTLPALMALLVAGTLAQGSMGIYDVQRLYFSSFILWAGPIPLPGGATLLSLLALNLTVKFIAFSEWNWRKAGIILAHLGALTLLVGGLLTALTAREGYMAIAEGEVSPFVYDYHARTLSVFKGDQGIAALPFESLRPGMEIKGLPFTLTPLDVCLNCDIKKRAETPQDFLKGQPRDFAANMALTPKPPEMENEVNLSGLTFAIDGATENENGSYIAFEGMPRPIEIGDYKIILGKTQRTLPFALELKDFRKADHPGTTMAAGFESDIIVKDGPANHPAAISMNKPLRYKGYTFYQSSFDQSNEADISVLSVVENQGRLVPYIGTLLIAAGLILHLAFALRRKMALIVFLCLLAPSAHAQTLPLNDFSTLPIQHEGRIKPLDSFARTMLSRLSGSENNASAWLAQSLFDPASAAETPLFKKPGEKNLISYTALQPFILETAPEVEKLLAEQPATLTQDQQNLLQLHDHFAAYGQILRALTLVLPLSAPPPESLKSLGPKNYELSYLDFSRLREDIDTLVKTTLKRKGENVETYTEEELRTVQLSYALDQIKSGAKPNTIFAVIPSENSVWQTPWESTSSPQSATTLALWQSAALAWQKNDAEGWSAALQSLRAETAARDDVRPAALRAENIYHALAPYTLAIALYALALLLLAIPRLQTFAAPAAALALGLHTTGITLRVFILERPPVGTLYESVLFVGLIAALIGLITTLKT